MTESNGLLDFAKSPAAMGLLAAGFGGLAGANKNTPWNNLGRAGLAGLAGYSAADALQQKQVKQDQADAIKAALPTLYGEDGNFDYRRAVELGVSPADAKAYTELPNAGRAKVARTIDVPGLNGEMVKVQYDDYGNQVGQGIQGYVAPQLVDTGDKKQFVTPQSGQSFDVGMSPAQRDAQARGWANVDIARDGNQVQRENNIILGGLKNQEKQLQVDKLKSEQAAAARDVEAKKASAAAQIGVIDKAINHPGRETVTGMSGVLSPTNYMRGTDARDFQVVNDQLQGAAFLQAFESLKGGGQITEVEGKKATDAMARLNTAQSDGEYKKSLDELRWVMVNGQRRLDGLPPIPYDDGSKSNASGQQGGAQAGGGYPSSWTPERVQRYEELKARQSQKVAQ